MYILNLKSLNTFIQPPHFKMKDNRTVMKLISRYCYMATIDLREAYFLIPVHKNYRKFLRFKFNNMYQFITLPFGLSLAPYIFTKIIRPVFQLLKQEGITSMVYIDNFLIIGKSERE